jgi:F-type H+-transporting ATPase subunit delta
MMIRQTIYYARALFSLNIREESIKSAKELLLGSKVLSDSLENPIIPIREKEAIIDKLFDKEVCGFLKVLCANQMTGAFAEIVDAYESMVLEHKNILRVVLSYVVKPDDAQIDQIKHMLCEKYQKTGVFLELKEDPSLIGGFVLYVGSTEYDKSIQGALLDMQKTLVGR